MYAQLVPRGHYSVEAMEHSEGVLIAVSMGTCRCCFGITNVLTVAGTISNLKGERIKLYRYSCCKPGDKE